MAALHFHDFTTTGKLRQGSNENHWNLWINTTSPVVPVLTHSLCHSLFAIVTPQPLTGTHSIFFYPCCHSSTSQSSLLFSFHLLLSDACSSFTHIKMPLPVPLFEILSYFPILCHNTLQLIALSLILCLMNVCTCLSHSSFHVQTWLEHTQKQYLQDRVVKQFHSL